MRRCLKALKLLVEKKVAEVEGNNLKAWEYQGMIKHHIKTCPSCHKLLLKAYEKSKIRDAYFSQSQIGVLSESRSSWKGPRMETA